MRFLEKRDLWSCLVQCDERPGLALTPRRSRRKTLLFESWWHSGCCDPTLLAGIEQPRSLLPPSLPSLFSPPLPSSSFRAHSLPPFFPFQARELPTLIIGRTTGKIILKFSPKTTCGLSVHGPEGYTVSVPGPLSLVQNTQLLALSCCHSIPCVPWTCEPAGLAITSFAC